MAGCSSPSETGGPSTSANASAHEAAPQQQSREASADPLAGTRWRLVEFQSMDDAIGAIRPDNPADYTLSLQADGTASLKLDCNSATGSWSAEPAGDGASGSFSFGPLAATTAICPEPTMGERVAADAAYVRGFLLRDERLYLSLMADAGIYAWQRESPVAFASEPDPALEAALLDASPDYTQDAVEIGGREARYAYGRVDLNGDGTPEVLAMPMGSIFCGTGGCNLLVLADTGDGYSVVNSFAISRLPVIVSNQQTNGWHDLIRPESGGGAPPSYVRHTFNGTEYVEAERLPGDVTPEGTWVLTGDSSYDTGFPLRPRG
jgi:hypothetical protein